MTLDLHDLFREADTLPVGPPPTDLAMISGRRKVRTIKHLRVAATSVLVAASVAAAVVISGQVGDNEPDSLAPAPVKQFTVGELQQAAASVFRGTPGQPDPRIIAYVEIPAARDRLIVAAAPSISVDELTALTDVPISTVPIDPLILRSFSDRDAGPGLVRPLRVARGSGTPGFIDRGQMDAVSGQLDFGSIQAALAWQKKMDAETFLRRVIPVFTKDGATVLGTFPITRSGTRVIEELPDRATAPRTHFPVGSIAPFTTGVHCGLQYVEIDGIKWEATVRYDKASRGPGPRMLLKPDVEENISGTLTRPEEDRAVYEVDPAFTLGEPLSVVFRPALGSVPGCS